MAMDSKSMRHLIRRIKAMDFSMHVSRQDLQVARPVVKFVPVDVVDLVALGNAPEELLSNSAVHEFPATLGPVEELAIAIEVTGDEGAQLLPESHGKT